MALRMSTSAYLHPSCDYLYRIPKCFSLEGVNTYLDFRTHLSLFPYHSTFGQIFCKTLRIVCLPLNRVIDQC